MVAGLASILFPSSPLKPTMFTTNEDYFKQLQERIQLGADFEEITQLFQIDGFYVGQKISADQLSGASPTWVSAAHRWTLSGMTAAVKF